MVVTDDKIYALFRGISGFLYGLDPTIQGNDEFKTIVFRKINPLGGNAIPFRITIRLIITDMGIVLFQLTIHQSHCGSAVHIVIAVYEYRFLLFDGLIDPTDGGFHVLHKKGIMKMFQFRPEEIKCLVIGVYAPQDQQAA